MLKFITALIKRSSLFTYVFLSPLQTVNLQKARGVLVISNYLECTLCYCTMNATTVGSLCVRHC